MDQQCQGRRPMAYMSPLLAPELNGAAEYRYSRERMRFEFVPRMLAYQSVYPSLQSYQLARTDDQDVYSYYHGLGGGTVGTTGLGPGLDNIGPHVNPETSIQHGRSLGMRNDRSNVQDTFVEHRQADAHNDAAQPDATVLVRNADQRNLKREISPRSSAGSTPERVRAALAKMEVEANAAGQDSNLVIEQQYQSPNVHLNEATATIKLRSEDTGPDAKTRSYADATAQRSNSGTEGELDPRFRFALTTEGTHRNVKTTSNGDQAHRTEQAGTKAYRFRYNWAEIARGSNETLQADDTGHDTEDVAKSPQQTFEAVGGGKYTANRPFHRHTAPYKKRPSRIGEMGYYEPAQEFRSAERCRGCGRVSLHRAAECNVGFPAL